MFLHIYLYRLKCAVRDRQMLFWTFLFPILLATLFGLTFTNLFSADLFQKIPIGVVDNAEYRSASAFQSALASVSGGKAAAGTQLFTVSVLSEAKADESLKKGAVSGYILFDGGPHVVVKGSGYDQTILKEFVDDYLQTSAAYQTILSQNPAAAKNLLTQSAQSTEYIKSVSPTKAAPNNTLTYYYALIAMACMYGGFWGMREVSAVQADHSPQGARVNLAPVPKFKVFGCSICAAFTVHFTSVLLLLGYLAFVLRVDFGDQLFYVLLACAAGCAMGVTLGAMVGVLRKGEGLKTAILIVISMFCSFFSGLMMADMKYIAASVFPASAYLNPANLVADSFYSLYYYTSHTRYFLNIGLLFAFSAVFSLVVCIFMRRKKYASL